MKRDTFVNADRLTLIYFDLMLAFNTASNTVQVVVIIMCYIARDFTRISLHYTDYHYDYSMFIYFKMEFLEI